VRRSSRSLPDGKSNKEERDKTRSLSILAKRKAPRGKGEPDVLSASLGEVDPLQKSKFRLLTKRGEQRGKILLPISLNRTIWGKTKCKGLKWYL